MNIRHAHSPVACALALLVVVHCLSGAASAQQVEELPLIQGPIPAEVQHSTRQAWQHNHPEMRLLPPVLEMQGVEPIPEGEAILSQEVLPPADNGFQFNFDAAPWPAALKSFAEVTGLSLTMQSDPQGELTYFDARRYPLDKAIDILNGRLIPMGHVLLKEKQELVLLGVDSPRLEQYVKFVDMCEIDLAGDNTVIGAAIPANADDIESLVEELSAVKSPIGRVTPLSMAGRVLVIDTGSRMRRIRDLLMRTGIARDDLVSEVFQLRHAKAKDVADAMNDFLTHETTRSQQSDSLAVHGASHVTAEATTNSLLLRGSATSVAIMRRIVCEFDRSPREVLLQALIVEVQLGDTQELGVEMGFQDSVLFDRSIVDSIQTVTQTATAANGVQTTNQSILSQVSTPGLNFNTAELGNNPVNPSRIGTQSLSNFGMGRVNGDLGFGGLVLSAGSESVNLLIRALDAKYSLEVLSRPQVRTVENVEALIQVGQQVPVVDGVAVNSLGAANPIIRQDRAGIILKATPRISPDGKVQVVVEAEKSAFNLTPGTGVPIFTDTATGRVIEAPVKDITTASTTVSIPSGQTIVLGGMITTDSNVVARQVPVLGSIPLIGQLFRYDLNRTAKKELIVFLTPIVLDSRCKSDALMAEELSHSDAAGAVSQQMGRWQAYRNGVLDASCAECSLPGTPLDTSCQPTAAE